jgi:hypothetical protein
MDDLWIKFFFPSSTTFSFLLASTAAQEPSHGHCAPSWHPTEPICNPAAKGKNEFDSD